MSDDAVQPVASVTQSEIDDNEISLRRFLRRIFETSAGGIGLVGMTTLPAVAQMYLEPYVYDAPLPDVAPVDAYAQYQYRRAFGTTPKFVAAYMDQPNGWQHWAALRNLRALHSAQCLRHCTAASQTARLVPVFRASP